MCIAEHSVYIKSRNTQCFAVYILSQVIHSGFKQVYISSRVKHPGFEKVYISSQVLNQYISKVLFWASVYSKLSNTLWFWARRVAPPIFTNPDATLPCFYHFGPSIALIALLWQPLMRNWRCERYPQTPSPIFLTKPVPIISDVILDQGFQSKSY